MQTETDALRYKWLRDYMLSYHDFFDGEIRDCNTAEEFDDVIDKAMQGLPFGVNK